MRCPHCGHWNRASFPRCFQCGAPLEPEKPDDQPREVPDVPPPSKVYIQINEEGRATSSVDERDKLAAEMKDLLARKEKGEEEQRRLRRDSASQGIAPSGRTVQNLTGRTYFPTAQSTSYTTDEEEIGGDVRPDAIPVVSPRTIDYDEYGDPGPAPSRTATHRTVSMRPLKRRRHYGLRRFVRVAAAVLIVAAVGLAGYQFVYKPLVLDQQEAPLQERAIITTSILDDMPAHTIRLPAQEGANIYIKELRKSYTVTGGYAVLDVPDYTWYEDTDVGDQAQITATITPYLKTSAGEQVPLEVFTFQVDVPLSPLTLISPDTGYAQVSTAIYNIQFQVEKNSTVYINGENYSDLVNTQDGLISYNASVLPIGNNEFKITTKAQYYRENSATVTIYRAVQDIPLDLATTLGNRSLKQTMTISATTLPGATITINSPYVSLDTSSLGSTGVFSFEAYFPKIGTNTVSITASYPGKRDSVVDYDVYYVPDATTYTAKAWPLYKASEYAELLSNMSLRIEKSQVYECTGEIIEIKATSPQLAVMEMGTGDTSRQVLLENRSTDTWVVGQRYRVYADVCGLYDSMPRLVGRYTYAPRN